jgi:hypothetical protein
MQANAGLKMNYLSAMEKASVFIAQFDQVMSHAFLFSFERGHRGVLILDGDRAGEVVHPTMDTVIEFVEQPTVTPSRNPVHWTRDLPGDKKFSLCLTTSGLFFSPVLQGERLIIGVETGDIFKLPLDAIFVTDWKIRPPEEAIPHRGHVV